MVSAKTKNILRIAWISFVLVALAVYLIFYRHLTEHHIAAFIQQYKKSALVLFLLICVLRGFTLIPSTPFLLAGILLFSKTPLLLLAVFMTATFIVSTLLFYASAYLGFDKYFERLYPEKIRLIRKKLYGRYGFLLIIIWAFAPFTPTDLVCYAAGSLHMRFFHFVIPLMFGEAVISALYIFNGVTLLNIST